MKHFILSVCGCCPIMMPSSRVAIAVTDKVEHLKILHLMRRWGRVAQCESTPRLAGIL